MKGFPKGFFTIFMCSFFVLFVSGLFLIPNMLDTHFVLPTNTLFFKRLSLFWLRCFVKTHGAFAFVCLVLLGALLSVHVRIGLYKKQRMVSGFILSSVFFLLILTGWGIHYLGDELALLAAAVAHTVLGCTIILVFGAHVLNRHF